MAHKKPKAPKAVKAPKVPKATGAERKLQKLDQNPLYNPATVLTGRNLYKAAQTTASQQYTPQINAADRAIKDTQNVGDEQSRRAGAYYTQLATEAQKNYDLQRALSDKVSSSLKGVSDESQARSDQAGQGVLQQLAQDQAIRGPGLDGGARERLAQEFAARQQNQANTSAAYRSAGENQSGNYGNLALANIQSNGLKGLETQGTIRGNTVKSVNDMIAKRADLEAQKGNAFSTALQKLRSDQFEQLATVQGLGIKQADLQAQTDQQKRQARLTRRQQDLANKQATARVNASDRNSRRSSATSRANNANTNATSRQNAANRAAAKGKPAGKKPTTPKSTTQGTLSNIAQVKALYLNLRGRPLSTIANSLRQSGKYTEAQIVAGADLATRGYVLPATRKKYKGELGLLPGSYRTAPKPVSRLPRSPF